MCQYVNTLFVLNDNLNIIFVGEWKIEPIPSSSTDFFSNNEENDRALFEASLSELTQQSSPSLPIQNPFLIEVKKDTRAVQILTEPCYIIKNDITFYPLGADDKYMYISTYNNTEYVNIRKVINLETYTKNGVAINEFEFKVLQQRMSEIKRTVCDLKNDHAEFMLGRFKMIQYSMREEGCLEFQKIIETDDKQTWGEGIDLHIFYCFSTH